MLRRRLTAFALLALGTACPSSAQAPDAEWRTLETATYRFHHPAPAAAFAKDVAARMEAIRERVALEVGYRPEGRTDVLVVDPLASANGSAWPARPFPRLVLYTTPPPADSVLGFSRGWRELLAVHEEAHLAHLLRPSRHPWEKALGRWSPVGPVARKAPNWVIEGYATLVEGRLTGFGRPHGDLRGSLLRRWAQLGALPTYGQLNGDPARFQGGGIPYLVGSAYLEWLVARQGEDALRHLWARLSARQPRSFDDAFAGVFGDSPARLYQRFAAELTYEAIALEKAAADTPSELWLDLAWQPSAPTLSADGERLALVVRERGKPAELRVYAVAVDQEAQAERERRIAEMLAADPADVAPRPARGAPRQRLHTLRARNGGNFFSPRFAPDGASLLYVGFEPDAEGFLHPDLFRWHPEKSDRVERLTWQEDLREIDLAPDGRSVVAVRHRWGLSSLVRRHLDDGRVEVLAGPTAAEVLGEPRFAPDGLRLAWLAQDEGGWRLRVRDLATGAEHEPPLPDRALVAHPAWSPDGATLYATLGAGGRLAIAAFDALPGGGFGPPRIVVEQPGAALQPSPSPDGQGLFFLALEADGYDLRRVQLAAPASGEMAPVKDETEIAAALVRRGLPPSAVDPPATATLPPDRPYGAGPQEWMPLAGAAYGADGFAFELGVRRGDPLGRLETTVIAGLGENGAPRGLLATTAWRGRPGTWMLRADDVREGEGELRHALRVVELGWRRGWLGRGRRLDVGAGVLDRATEGDGAEAGDATLGFAELGMSHELDLGTWRFGGQAGGRFEAGDGAERSAWRLRGELERAPVGALALRLGVELRGRRAGLEGLRWGGQPTSLLPSGLDLGRLERPGLTAGTVAGAARHESERLDLAVGDWPLVLFAERHRFGDGPWRRVRGLELRGSVPTQPLLRLPAAEFQLGVAEWEDDYQLWAAWVWRP